MKTNDDSMILACDCDKNDDNYTNDGDDYDNDDDDMCLWGSKWDDVNMG